LGREEEAPARGQNMVMERGAEERINEGLFKDKTKERIVFGQWVWRWTGWGD
jgi:hypothetical protein